MREVNAAIEEMQAWKVAQSKPKKKS